MKTLLKRWKELGQIIEIVAIRIDKQQRMLMRLRKHQDELQAQIVDFWQRIELFQEQLRTITIAKENNALTLFFMRRENIKTNIESIFFDVSLTRQKLEALEFEIAQAEAEKRNLEKRKDALNEIRDEIASQAC